MKICLWQATEKGQWKGFGDFEKEEWENKSEIWPNYIYGKDIERFLSEVCG